MSGGSYQPFDLSEWTCAENIGARASGDPFVAPATVAGAVAATVATPKDFPDWGKGADFRHFQRERDKTVATVAAVATPRLPWSDGMDLLKRLDQPRWVPYVLSCTEK